MKYVSLDLETSSLEPNPKHILMLSMVVEDTEAPDIPVELLPHFTCFVKHDQIIGQAYALSMNGWILDIISGRTQPLDKIPLIYSGANAWTEDALDFLEEHFGPNRITVAGKNVAGFDIPFLPPEIRTQFKHRVLDPGSLFVDWTKDKGVPDFAECKRRAGIDTPIAHDAHEDAMDVIRCFRTRYTGGPKL